MNFDAACQVAASWARLSTRGQAVIYRGQTVALRTAGFFYNSPEYVVDPSKNAFSMAGNAPIPVDRINGELRVLGPRYKDRLKEFEPEMPSACLQMKPEDPRW